MERPTYMMFAGVNGAGKSTFYRTNHWKLGVENLNIPRINPDEIIVRNGGDPLSDTDQIRAAKEAVRNLNSYLNRGLSFNQETTLTGHLPLKTVKRAKEIGYRIVLYYIGVESPEIAINRIKHRTSIGGHHISDQAVRRRWDSSLDNLMQILHLSDEAILLDNTFEFVPIAHWSNGVLSWVGNLKQHGKWLLEAIGDGTYL